MKVNKAFSSLEFIVTLFFLSLILIALGFFLRNTDLSIKRKTSNKDDKEKIDIVLDTIFEEIKKDTTPDVDSKMDPVWKLNDTTIDGFEVTIKSLSGLINLNYISRNILENTGFSNLFVSSDSIKKLDSMIKEKGPITSYEEINDLITEEKFNENFTFYGYSNFNITDEVSLAFLGNSITQTYFGDELVNKRKSLIRNKQFIQNSTDFNLLCGIYYEDISPFINILPTLNVNFLSEESLRNILGFPGFKLPGARQKVNTIISMRDYKEITQEELVSILGITKKSELYYYIGCKTWFWQISIKGKHTVCNVVIARDPDDGPLGQAKLYLIEKKWL